MYVTDERFTEYYDRVVPGYAAWLRDAAEPLGVGAPSRPQVLRVPRYTGHRADPLTIESRSEASPRVHARPQLVDSRTLDWGSRVHVSPSIADSVGKKMSVKRDYGRTLWATVLAWLPVESVIRERQQEYYRAFMQSEAAGSSEVFVTFMLEVIRDALKPYVMPSNGSDRQRRVALLERTGSARKGTWVIKE